MSIYKRQISLRHIIIAIVISAIIGNLLIIFDIIFSDINIRHRNTLSWPNYHRWIASGLGIVGLMRYKVTDYHSKSYLFLTIGLILWLTADIIIALGKRRNSDQ